MNESNDSRVVMTLDAGGTNFVFSAIRANQEVAGPITLPSHGDNLAGCLQTILEGFGRIADGCPVSPVAISFAFPGPADYPRGIIGDLGNLPAFRGGVPLGPILEERFHLPVHINNDGDLFAYGESIAGFLPWVNGLLAGAGSPKRYRNLLAVTLGTGFGGGIVRDGRLFLGDNSAAGEIWLLRDKRFPERNVEEGASIRAVRRVYAEAAGIAADAAPSPKEIADIARGVVPGDRSAAARAFRELGEVVGDALSNAVTLIDGLVVVGGGLSGASALFFPAMLAEMNGAFVHPGGSSIPRLEFRVFDLDNPQERESFLQGERKEIPVPGTSRKIAYDPLLRTGVGITRLGTSKAVAIGAYAFALHALDSPPNH